MKKLTLDDHAKILSARWKHPTKYRKKLIVQDHGYSYYTIKWDKTDEDILAEIEKDNAPIIQVPSLVRIFLRKLFKGK